jgi:sec-independent protein translocase protein TatA
MPIGIPELLIILVIILVIFGPKRLPMLGRQLGGGMREFKDSLTRKGGQDDEDDERDRAPTGERDEAATRRGG